MDKAKFWEIIDGVTSASSSPWDRPEALRAALEKLSPDEIQEFDNAYRSQVDEAYSWPLWGAAYVINGGCSDDGFDYFRDWLISEGQATYDAALKDPESLAELSDIEDASLEEFRYVAGEVYEQKAGKPMDLAFGSGPGEPAGEPWDEDTVDKLYPRLAAKYW